jgi:hypothetical protein
LIYPSFVLGTAEGFAEQIKQEGERHGNYTINLRFAIIEIMSCVKDFHILIIITAYIKGFKVTVADLEDFSPDEFNDSLRVAIMVMATYGEGEPTDNASAFIKWCKVITTTYTHI